MTIRGYLARTCLALLTLALLSAITGALIELREAPHDLERYPPPGQLIDVGGYRLHLQCLGEGTPTVLLDAVSGGWSAHWVTVQPELARTTRICAWDRAGSGWSDLGTHDHTPGAYAAELDVLLRNTGVAGPYVLVGASYGGKVARMFAADHLSDIQGAVFVDASHEDAFTPEEIVETERQVSLYGAANWMLSRLGIARLLGPDLVAVIDGPVADQLTQRDRELIGLLATRPSNLEGNARLARNHRADDARLGGAGSLGDRSVTVLTATASLSRYPRWGEAQRRLAALSSDSDHQILDSAHLIQWQHPRAVIGAVESVLNRAARRSAQ